jgi:hypothetical protein
MSSSNGSNGEICRYSKNEPFRPANKAAAVGEDVVGSTVIGSTGGAAATQVGTYVCAYYLEN